MNSAKFLRTHISKNIRKHQLLKRLPLQIHNRKKYTKLKIYKYNTTVMYLNSPYFRWMFPRLKTLTRNCLKKEPKESSTKKSYPISCLKIDVINVIYVI